MFNSVKKKLAPPSAVPVSGGARDVGLKLTIEIVPESAHYKNVRSAVSPAEWKTICRHCYGKAGYRCEVCGGVGPKHPVECHEVWHYDDSLGIQKLVGLVALCPACHEVKHIGLAQVKGRMQEAVNHLVAVNNLSAEGALEYIQQVIAVHRERSRRRWTSDISFITDYLST